ncbi:hypothetical protein [Amycolatopsis sp. NPDC001319]|uniref:hypothetical protein n=1 Tax=unclassified Amycolatopsis TaxID=2618356 RepID=UPI0036AC6472
MRDDVRRSRALPLLVGAVVVATSLSGCGTPAYRPIHQALVDPAGTKITVQLEGGGCGSIRLEARENNDTVSLGAVEDRDSAAPPCSQILAAVIETATLTRPLAGRALTDRSTGAPIKYFDGAELAAIAYVPAGFRFDRDQFDAQSSAPPIGPQAPVAWCRVYTHGGGRGDELLVTQALPGSGVLAWPADRTSRVGRMGAQVRRSGSSVGLVWTADGFEFAVYSLVYNTFTGRALPVNELARVAESIQH